MAADTGVQPRSMENIRAPRQARQMAEVSDGAIVGRAIVKIIAQYKKEAGPKIREYVQNMKAAVLEAADKNFP